MIFIKILYGIIFFVCGIGTLKYRKIIYEWTGRFAWAERYLGNGGTVLVITLIGMLLIFLSITYPTGVIKFSNDSNGNFNKLEQKYTPQTNNN